MRALRLAAFVLVVGLLPGCSLFGTDYRLWHKTNASNDEMEAALSACAPESRVGSSVGNRDPGTYFNAPATADQVEANRLFQRCMANRGWWAMQPNL